MKRALLLLLLLVACAHRAAPPPAPPAASALQACNDLPAQSDAALADEHVTKFELRAADVDISTACFNSGGHRVVPEKKSSGVLVFSLHIKKSALAGLVKYHLHLKDGSATLAYDNEIRPSKHADDLVKLTVIRKDGQLDATQAR